MEEDQQDSILKCEEIINANVDKEEIIYYLKDEFPEYESYFSENENNPAVAVSEIFLFLKDVPGSFQQICKILEVECAQSYIVDCFQQHLVDCKIETDTSPKTLDNVVADEDVSQSKENLSSFLVHHVHFDVAEKMLEDITSGNTDSDFVLNGGKGAGKSSLVSLMMDVLESKSYQCLLLDLSKMRFSNIVRELETFILLKTQNARKCVFFDSCSSSGFRRLNDGSDSCIYSELKVAMIQIFIVVSDDVKDFSLSNPKMYGLPPCNDSQVKKILKSNFNFDDQQTEFLFSSVANVPHFPLPILLVGTLYTSVKESRIELLLQLSSSCGGEVFIDAILQTILEFRSNIDELKVLAAVALFSDLCGAHLSSLQSLLGKQKLDDTQIRSYIDILLNCKLIVLKDDKYWIQGNILEPLLKISNFVNVWNDVVVLFTKDYLMYLQLIIESILKDTKSILHWKNAKNYIIKSLTCKLTSSGSSGFESLIKQRTRLTSQIKVLWQSGFLSFTESVDIYETVIDCIGDMSPETANSQAILMLERTILIHYLSLFFYFVKVSENREILSLLFTKVDSVNKKLSNPTDEQFCELVSLIIEYKINGGMLQEAMRSLKVLISVQKSIDISKDSVALTKIRLAQLKILQHEDLDFDTDEILGGSFSSTPLNKPQFINTKIRMSRGDFYYMKSDFVSTGWNYSMALYGIEDMATETSPFLQSEYLRLAKEIKSRLGKLALLSDDCAELSKSLQNFQRCQEIHGQLENGKKYHKYFVYCSVAHLLKGENSKALYELLDYIKYHPNRSMFIAVTNLDAQLIISKNLQERLEGNELNFIDNHVYQGRVNFLHLTKSNYDWVKNQASDELIEIDMNIPDKTFRANVLQFPNQRSQTNKCLVVVFMETVRNRTCSGRTSVSEVTDISLSSFRSEIIEPNDDELDGAHPESTTVRPRSIVDAVFQNSLLFAREVVDHAKTSFLENLATSLVDRIF